MQIASLKIWTQVAYDNKCYSISVSLRIHLHDNPNHNLKKQKKTMKGYFDTSGSHCALSNRLYHLYLEPALTANIRYRDRESVSI